MTELKNNICPCCGKGCDLSNLRCSRGEEYLRTGIIPEKGQRQKEHTGGRPRGERREKEHKHRHYSGCEGGTTAEKLYSLLLRVGRVSHHISGGRESQKKILSLLHKNGGMSQRELTETLGIQPGSASEILKKLEAAGYLIRKEDPQDRRGVNLSLTEAGIAEAASYAQQHQQNTSDLFAALSDEEQNQLLALLEKLLHSWHEQHHGKDASRHHGGGHRHQHKKEG